MEGGFEIWFLTCLDWFKVNSPCSKNYPQWASLTILTALSKLSLFPTFELDESDSENVDARKKTYRISNAQAIKRPPPQYGPPLSSHIKLAPGANQVFTVCNGFRVFSLMLYYNYNFSSLHCKVPYTITENFLISLISFRKCVRILIRDINKVGCSEISNNNVYLTKTDLLCCQLLRSQMQP